MVTTKIYYKLKEHISFMSDTSLEGYCPVCIQVHKHKYSGD